MPNGQPLGEWLPNFVPGESPRGLVKPRLLSLSSVSDCGGLEWDLRVHIPDKCPGETDVAGLGTML